MDRRPHSADHAFLQATASHGNTTFCPRALALLLLALSCHFACAQSDVMVDRWVQVSGLSALEKNDTGPFNKEINHDVISGDEIQANQFVRHDSGPFIGNFWQAECRVSVAPVAQEYALGAVAQSFLKIDFTVTQPVKCDFSCSVTGVLADNSVRFDGPQGVGTIVDIDGNDPVRSFKASGITLTRGNYFIRAEARADGGHNPSEYRGGFRFELQFFPTTCVETRTLSIPADFGCNASPGPVFSSPQFANGRLEMQCITPSCVGAPTLGVRWIYPGGETRYIGLARYEGGVVGCDYTYDTCSGKVTEVKWTNGERYGSWGEAGAPPSVRQDLCHGIDPDRYEKDRYVFNPETRQLNISKALQWIYLGAPKGPVSLWDNSWSGLAPTDFCTLYDLPLLATSSFVLCLPPDQLFPRRSFTRLHGVARTGHIRLAFRDRNLGHWLTGGETPDQVATVLAQRINADTNFTARGITATAFPATSNELAGLSLENVADEDLSFDLTGQDTTGLRIIGLLDFPVLKTSLLPAGLTLSWQTNVAGFIAESTTDPAAPVWTPVTAGPTITNGMNVLTPPLTPGNQFYRLRLP